MSLHGQRHPVPYPHASPYPLDLKLAALSHLPVSGRITIYSDIVVLGSQAGRRNLLVSSMLAIIRELSKGEMMSETNIQVVKNGFEKFFTGDIPGFLELLAADVHWDHRGPESVPFNRLYKGREDVGEFFKVLNEMQEASIFEPREFFAAGDRVVCLGFFQYKVYSTNKEWESDFAMAFTVRNKKITHWRIIFNMGAEAAAYQG